MRTRTPRWWRRKAATAAALVGAGLVTLGCTLGADIVSYDLPEEAARYTLEVQVDEVVTQWEFTSAHADETDALEHRVCMGAFLGSTEFGECRVEPLIFLTYDLGLNLDNTVPAARAHEVTITGYYEERLSEPPVVTGLQVEASFDGGASWQPAAVAADGDNIFTATIPAAGNGPESVTLRVTGTDSQGNRVVQTVPNAYGLS